MIKQACILVGGRGTRLGRLTDRIPKPLLPVGGHAFLDYLLENVARHHIEEVLLLSAYRSAEVETHYHGTMVRGTKVRCIPEGEPRGTAGALWCARQALQDTFLVLNGDTLFDINLLDLAMPRRGEWLARLALRAEAETAQRGRVTLNEDQVTGFAEKDRGGPGIINGGIYFMRRNLIEKLDDTAGSLEEQVFPRLASEGLLLGRVYERPFIDIGILEDLVSAEQAVPHWVTRPAAFLDRDGILNNDQGYVHRLDEFEWMSNAKEAVKILNDSGFFVFVVTNQAGVAHGYYTEADVINLHAWMTTELASVGAHVDGFYHCPHHPNGSIPAYRMVCSCRKPAPGLLIRAFAEWSVRRDGSFVIGDKISDLEAAAAAGIPGYLLQQNEDLAAVVARIIR
jgi:D-glycero-D-manno-heptose 1,7-bisphosphate phosphatase